MRLRLAFLTFVVFVGTVAFPAFAQAKIPFFGPIVPDAINRCAASYAALVIVINNIIQFALTMAIVIVLPLTIAYAGFLLVTNPFQSDAHGRARSMILHAVVGIVIALGAWLIVNAVMVTLLPNQGQTFGKRWQDLISSNGVGLCLPIRETLSQVSGQTFSGVSTGGVPYLAPRSGNCSPDALVSAGIDPSIANKMSCIAQKESSCNLNAQNPSSSARGLFQITMSQNDKGHNLNFPQCSAAAQAVGWQGSGELNCSQAFGAGGRIREGQEELARVCMAASGSMECNAVAAQWLYDDAARRGDGFKPWVTAGSCTG